MSSDRFKLAIEALATRKRKARLQYTTKPPKKVVLSCKLHCLVMHCATISRAQPANCHSLLAADKILLTFSGD